VVATQFFGKLQAQAVSVCQVNLNARSVCRYLVFEMFSFARSSPALDSCNFPAFRSVGVKVSRIGKDIGREPAVHPPQALILDFRERFSHRQHSVNIATSYAEIIYPFVGAW